MFFRGFVFVCCCAFLFINCKKGGNPQVPSPPQDTVDTSRPVTGEPVYPGAVGKEPVDTTVIPPADSFITYFIKKGNNYCENNSYAPTTYTSIHFRAILDSSCIYTTADPVNQEDINKLYGFADCSSFHQTNSARFGWNWDKGQMHIHAYCYDKGVRTYKELGTVQLNKAFDCMLTVLPGKYIFTLDGKTDTISRGCTDVVATGYKLLPYFGGNEVAPKDIRVKIREL